MEDLIIHDKRHQLFLIAVVCFGAFMANLDGTIVNVCLPTIASDFGISPGMASLVVLAYLLFETAPLMAFGKLGDIYGGRPVFLAGFALFTISSFTCGVSSTLWQLIAARVFQGIGGAMIFSVILSFTSIYFPSEKRGRAMGFMTMAAAIGVAIGPTIGGFIAHYIGWRFVFFVNVPVGIIALVSGYFILPKKHPKVVDSRFDFAGAIYQTLFLFLLIFAINKGLELGWTSLPILSAFVGCLVMAVLFWRREMSIDYPVLDLKLFSNRDTLFATINLCLSMMALGGVLFLMPFYLQDVSGLTASIIGLVMSVISFGQFLGPFAGQLGMRTGYRKLVLAGVSLGLVAFIMFFIMDFGEPLWWVISALVVFGLSQGLNRTPNMQMVMTSVSAEKKGSVASLTSLMRSLGLVLGVVLFETALSEFIPSHISVNNLSLKNSGLSPEILHEAFLVSFGIGIVLSLTMVLLIAAIKKPAVKTV